ncbi:AMP-dependent synthetase and ligase [Caballeronia hypogeia]|uniref:acetate--CoA ligase n=1 Tax=Caballeronia hypogeia TaxID=1777140 RepID=A0A158DN35_9BURK|nr:AMP-binding protein [Caballeronia hypogeia]SAK96051.1 AMP-dependent synthetase and ligase [Caballeronia hypogeia]
MKGRAKFGDAQAAVWQPGVEHVARSRLAAAMKRWGFSTLEALHTASVDRPEWFWPAAAEDLGISLRGNVESVRDDSRGRLFPQWFKGATLNVVESCVDRHAADPVQAQRTAVVYEGDSGQHRSLTFAGLKLEVDRFAAGLRRLGVGKGDRVALFMPPVPEAAVTIMACAKIGAIGVPAFSGYGSESLATRLQAAEAKVLVTVDSTTRRGKPVPMKAIADEAAASSRSVQHLVVIRASGEPVAINDGRDYWWHEVATPLSDGAEPEAPEALDPNHPLLIIYTSGTTGLPKGIVHSHIGYLLKSAVDFGYAFDLQVGDTLGWIADMGWMLGPLMIVGGLQCGSGIVMAEGLPDHPAADRLWDMVERHRLTVLGISPTAARGLRARADSGRPAADLTSLRAFASTGEAWDEPTWHWLFDTVGQSRLPILNYSGGTETGGGILSCYTIAPQAPASFSGPLPGMDVDVLDADARPTSEIGELAVHNTWVGMTHGFWRDDARYLDTYWSRWPDTWVHGDLASIDAHGYWHIHGRSDDTLKIGGRRVGPSEIESALVAQPGIAEAAVIGAPDAVKGQEIVAFVVARDSAAPPQPETLVAAVTQMLGKAMAPSRVHVVDGLPKTKNGKIMRRAIRARYLGEKLGDLSAHDPLTPLEHIPARTSAA